MIILILTITEHEHGVKITHVGNGENPTPAEEDAANAMTDHIGAFKALGPPVQPKPKPGERGRLMFGEEGRN